MLVVVYTTYREPFFAVTSPVKGAELGHVRVVALL